MKRTLVALALAAHLAAPSFAFAAADAPPSVPGNPTLRLYPGAGGELFWGRSTDDRGVRGYEITRNGRNLGVRDATSYYDASLTANTAYTFTVAAVDTAGQKSPAATVRIGASTTVQPAAPAAPTTPATPVRPSTSTPAPVTPVAPVPTPAAGAPAAPAGLRATVYGRSNAELFWNRSATPGLRYEVRRDGTVVATGDFTSHYAPNLSAGRDYSFEVVAIDRSDRRSPAARVRFRTDANTTVTGSSGTPATPAAPSTPARPANPMAPTTGTPPTTGPTTGPTTNPGTNPGTTPGTNPGNPPAAAASLAPVGLRVAVYSGTTAELLWTPGTDSRGPILKNEVRRNGTLVATLQGYNLRSYLDSGRTPGTAYTYEVTAISAAARASATVGGAAAQRPTQPPAPVAGSTLPANVAGKLAVDFELVNGKAVEKIVAVGRRLRNPEALGLRRTSAVQDPNNPTVTAESWACTGGGTLGVQRLRNVQPDGSTLVELDGTVRATDCALGPLVISGAFYLSEEAGDVVFISGGDVAIDDSRDLSTIEASYWGASYTVNRPETSSFDALDLNVERVNGSYRAAQLRGNAADSANALPDGRLGYTVSITGVTGGLGNDASILSTGPFEYANGRGAGKPTGGRLSIASGQDTWKIDAFNGDPASFTFTTSVGGATTSYTVPWSDGYRVKGIDPARVEVGF